MKTSKLIVTFMLVMCITLVSGSSVFANEDNTINEPNKEQVISSKEDEKESLQQEEAKVKEEKSSNTINDAVDNSKKESTPASKTKKSGSRAIINSTWGTSLVTFDESTGVLTVGAGELVQQAHSSYLDTNALINKKDVIKIILEDGVKAPDASSYLFSTYTTGESRFINLVGIYGKLDTSQATSMNEMFKGAEKLEEVDVSNWDTSNVNNMYSMFYTAYNLKFLDVSNWNTSNVKNMGDMFGFCTSLNNINVSNWKTDKVTDMEFMFADTWNLTSLDVSNWDTGNVKNMSWMFDYADKLTTLDVSNWNTSKVTDMGGMFYGASKINSLNVTNWDTSKVIDMLWMFKEATNLAELDVSNWDTSSVVNMVNMFSSASSLKSLDVTNWDTSKVADMNNMLNNVKLETFTLGNKSIFNVSVNLPAIDTISGEYTGRWERINPVAPESIYDSSNVFMSNYDGSMTGTYVWQRTSYTITYELDGGTNHPSNPLSYAHGVGVDSFADATRDGYAFLGWVDADDNPVTNISNTDTGNKVLYATWQIAIPLPAEVYTITYELDGGTNNLSNPLYYSHGVGVSSFADATKDGYTFLGWKDANNNPITSISDTDTGNKTLYAKWKKNSNNPENPGDTDNGGTNKNKGNNNNPVDKGKPSTLPQTGDSSSVSAMILLLAGSFITGGYLITKRKKQ